MRSGRTAASTASDYVLGGHDATLAATSATGRATATNISIVAKDVDGNVVPLAAVPTAVISDALVISDVTIADCAGQASTTVCAAGAGNYIASTTSAIGGVSGATATVTFRTPHPTVAGTYISTAALPFSLGGTALGGTVTMTLDKATYAPGERMVITYTAKDSAGNPVRDWTAVAAPSANKSVPGLAGGIFVAGKEIIGDEAGEYVYAPVSPGDFTITLGTGTATGAEITAKATVSDDAATAASSAAADAAAEATDAANAATDAANAAAEAADAATAAAQDAADAVAALSTAVSAMVSDLKKQITALTNLVIKIQKKVRA
jgi:flagellin-like hook-associated protein FlgL